MTVLFADVVHSMDIAAKSARNVCASSCRNCSTAARRCPAISGTVDKFTGDGIMAVFGAPMALEDHAIRACLAALKYSKEPRTRVEVKPRRNRALRVGLNSGEVIAGEVGSLAARLHDSRRAGRDGAADGDRGAARWGDAERIYGRLVQPGTAR